MRSWLAGIIVALVAVLPSSLDVAAAQSAIPGFVFVQDSGGQVWLTTRESTLKVPVPIYPATDEQIRDIPSSNLWVIPKPDGSGTTAGPRPEWAAPLPDAPPASAEAPPPSAEHSVKLSGERGENSKPFDLRGGNYTVSWKTQLHRDATSCFSAATLYRVEGKRYVESLYRVTLKRDGEQVATGDTEVYGVTPGQHFLETNTTACSWSVEIRPQ